jgi:hypothetical protein
VLDLNGKKSGDEVVLLSLRVRQCQENTASVSVPRSGNGKFVQDVWSIRDEHE